jgi:lysophospholipase L1-like esterase
MNTSIFRTCLLLGVCLFVSSSAFSSDGKALGRILPLGDSITAGYLSTAGGEYVPGGYRQELYDRLTAEGYSFDFVGSQTIYSTPLLDAVGQNHHEGHNAYSIQQIIDGITQSNWLLADPDIILLHIGANDVLEAGASTAPARLNTLLNEITARTPDAHVIVAQIIGGSTVVGHPIAEQYDSAIAAYNMEVAGIVEARRLAGDNISLVDMYSLMNINHQTNELGQWLFGDTSHPSQVGYDLIGNAWADAITTIPEPATIILLTLGGSAYLIRRKATK